MFYRDNTTFGLSIEIANLSNLSGWPSQTKTFHLSCFTALSLSKNLLYLGSKILKLHFQNQSNLWVGQNVMAIHQLLRTILKAFCQSSPHLTNFCKSMSIRANMISSRLQITAIFTRNTLVDICAMICIPDVLKIRSDTLPFKYG